jgi:nitrogen regulatory protein P-II 1
MKLVTAVIRSEMYAAVQKALDRLHITQLTLSDAWGESSGRGETFVYRSVTFQETRVKRLRLEVVVDDVTAEAAVEAIMASSWTGRIGDGIVLVQPLDAFNRISTAVGQQSN